MTQNESIDVKCPQCSRQFSATSASVGSRIACPHCGNQVKIAGPVATRNDDEDWLRLDDDFPPPTAKTATSAPTVTPSTPDIFDDPELDEFTIPNLPPVQSLPKTVPIAGPTSVPPLSQDDLDALRGFSNDNDQLPAPVKVVREPPPGDSFRVRCPTCESITYAKFNQVGKKIRCGDCHSTIVVPPPPKVKPKYQPDMESAKAFTFQDGDNSGEHLKPADPFRKSADEYLRQAEASVEEKPDDDWSVPSMADWFNSVVGIFRDPAVVMHWVFLSLFAAVPAAIAILFSSKIIVMGIFAGGLLFAGIVVAHGFAILQSTANGETKVREWPAADFWAWMGPLMIAVSAIAVAAGPLWLFGQYVFGFSLATVAMTMLSLYVLYPFVLLSMLDEQSVFVPFSVEVSKSVTRSSEAWGIFYLSSAIVFFALFLIFMIASTMPPMVTAAVSIAATVAGVFIYFGLIGQLAFSIGQAVNAPPMENDIQRNPKLPD